LPISSTVCWFEVMLSSSYGHVASSLIGSCIQ